jgi:predicted nucleic acid-binding protein
MSYDIPQRLFLDTNIYIIGIANQDSYERKILESVGFLQSSSVEVIVSEELLNQILRVSKRLYNKVGVVKLSLEFGSSYKLFMSILLLRNG